MMTKNYEFFIKDNKFLVRYNAKDKIICLSDLEITIVGVTETDSGYAVVIITPASIGKIKHNVSDSLDVIGFDFETLDKALEVQNFIMLRLRRIRDAKQY